MVKYKYNAWGTATQVITQGCEELDVLYNPFKFKGYFYDGETGFYYLKTRYLGNIPQVFLVAQIMLVFPQLQQLIKQMLGVILIELFL